MAHLATSRGGALGGRALRSSLGRAALLSPGVGVLLLLALLPMGAIAWSGFRTPEADFTTEYFGKVLGSGTYMGLLARTLAIALVVAVVSIAVGWPAGWALAKHTSARARPLILGLVVVPYITSQLLLIYGFITLIQSGGPVMSVLVWAGIAKPGGSIMYTLSASVLMLIYESISTAVLLTFSASEQIDDSLLEAARSLGAGRVKTFFDVVWPLSSLVLITNFAITYVQTVGAFAEPGILGGTRGQMMGNAISAQLNSAVGQQLAIALSLTLLIASLIVVAAAAAGIALFTRSRSDVALDTSGRFSANPELRRRAEEVSSS